MTDPRTSREKPTVSQMKRKAAPRSALTKLREDAHLGLREVANAAGISPATLCRVEAGRAPDVTTALRLARFYESTVEQLFGHFAAIIEGPR